MNYDWGMAQALRNNLWSFDEIFRETGIPVEALKNRLRPPKLKKITGDPFQWHSVDAANQRPVSMGYKAEFAEKRSEDSSISKRKGSSGGQKAVKNSQERAVLNERSAEMAMMLTFIIAKIGSKALYKEAKVSQGSVVCWRQKKKIPNDSDMEKIKALYERCLSGELPGELDEDKNYKYLVSLLIERFGMQNLAAKTRVGYTTIYTWLSGVRTPRGKAREIIIELCKNTQTPD